MPLPLECVPVTDNEAAQLAQLTVVLVTRGLVIPSSCLIGLCSNPLGRIQ